MQFPFTCTGSLCLNTSDCENIISKMNDGMNIEEAIRDIIREQYGYDCDDVHFLYIIPDPYIIDVGISDGKLKLARKNI